MNKRQIGRLIVSLFLLLTLAVLAASAVAFPPAGADAAAPTATLSHSSYLPLMFGSPSLYDWLQFNGDARHSGSNTLESTFSPANVGQLHVLFQIALPAAVDSAPVYLSRVATAGGTRALVFVTTRAGDVLA